MARYLEKWTSVEALRFDGSPESALAIAEAFPGFVARPFDGGDAILVLTETSLGEPKLRELAIGVWVVRRPYSDTPPKLLSEALFTPYHELIKA